MKKKQRAAIGYFQRAGQAIDNMEIEKIVQLIRKGISHASDTIKYIPAMFEAVFLVIMHRLDARVDNTKLNRNPLSNAIYSCNMRVIEVLVELFHYDVNAEDPGYYHYLPLECALDGRDSIILDKLLSYGADLESIAVKDPGNIIKAMWYGEDAVLRMLKRVCGRKNQSLPFDDKFKKEMIDSIQYYWYCKLMDFLFERGLDINLPNAEGSTALHLACNNGHGGHIRYFLKKSADVMARDRNGKTPLHLLIYRGELQSADMIIAAGADVNAQDNDGRTPLHVFCSYKCSELVQLLLERGADVRLADKRGLTPLHYALSQKMDAMSFLCFIPMPDEVAALLIKSGAEVNARSKDGKTPLHLAASNGLADAARMLINAGADPMIKDKEGNTPLALACKDRPTALMLLPKQYCRAKSPQIKPKPAKQQLAKVVRKKASPKPAAKKQIAKSGKAGGKKAKSGRKSIFIESNKTTLICKVCKGTFYSFVGGASDHYDDVVCQGCGREINVGLNTPAGSVL